MKSLVSFIVLIILVLLATLPFHYIDVGGDFKVIAKDHFTFENTYIDKDDINKIIARYNEGNFFEKMAIQNEPLFKKLEENGYIIDPSKKQNTQKEKEAEGANTERMAPEMVTVGDFSIGKYEVTQSQWLAVMGSNPSLNKGCDNCPVENVSWNDVQDFLKKLNSMTGKNYRLPTEAEWEYAAKGGSHTHGYEYAGSNNVDDVVWYGNNSGNKTHEVGQKQPNELGIYDMTGNVMEWCSDWHDASQQYLRAILGGSYSNDSGSCQLAFRGSLAPDSHGNDMGFRVAINSGD